MAVFPNKVKISPDSTGPLGLKLLPDQKNIHQTVGGQWPGVDLSAGPWPVKL